MNKEDMEQIRSELLDRKELFDEVLRLTVQLDSLKSIFPPSIVVISNIIKSIEDEKIKFSDEKSKTSILFLLVNYMKNSDDIEILNLNSIENEENEEITEEELGDIFYGFDIEKVH